MTPRTQNAPSGALHSVNAFNNTDGESIARNAAGVQLSQAARQTWEAGK